ncbi:MAG: adenine phosphoribosyltransferase [Fibrobacter sp.]|nr:adenine phosphoribosyltransferase [Fibrobacter sp.]
MSELKKFVREIPDFPKPGILFRDITGILQSAEGFKLAIDELQKIVEEAKPDVIVALESRGFLFGTPIAYNLNIPVVLCRKKGKLPCATVEKTYDLEYGSATVEIHKDAIQPGQRVLIIDDLLATGGTAKAAIDLAEMLGGKVVKLVFVMELLGLEGRRKLDGYDVGCVLSYEGA